VTPEGTCYQGRMVTGGRPDEAGPLGMKRELRAVSAELIHLEQRCNAVQSELEIITADLQATEKAQEELTARQRESERMHFSAKHRHEQMQSELARLGLDLAVCQNELAHVRKEIDSVQQRALLTQTQHQLAASNRAEAETETVRLTEEVAQLRNAVQSERDELSTA